jgi:hypothetical protein
VVEGDNAGETGVIVAMGHGLCVFFCLCGVTMKNENCFAMTFGGDYGNKEG